MLFCKFVITRKNDAFVAILILHVVAKIANKRLTKHCVAIFALAKRLPSSATQEEAEGFISLSILHFLVYIQVLYKPGMVIIENRYPTDPIKMSIRRGSEAKWDSCKAFS